MISEFRSVLAQNNPEDMIRDFERVVNHSAYYFAESLRGYKGWSPVLIQHTEDLQFGFLNLGFRNLTHISSNSQGVALSNFSEICQTLENNRKALYLYTAMQSPDHKTAFVYGKVDASALEMAQKVFLSIAQTLGSKTLATWVQISDKETPGGLLRRVEAGDFDTPDLDDIPEVAKLLGVEESLARQVVNLIYALDMESSRFFRSLKVVYDDLSLDLENYLTKILFEQLTTAQIYNNMTQYQTR